MKIKWGPISYPVVQFNGYRLGINIHGEAERWSQQAGKPDYVVKIPPVSLGKLDLAKMKGEIEDALANPQRALDEGYKRWLGVADVTGRYVLREGKLDVTIESPARLAELEAARAAEEPERGELEGLGQEELERLCRGITGNFISALKNYPGERVNEEARLLVLEGLCRMTRSLWLIGERIGNERLESIGREEFGEKGGLSDVDVGIYDRVSRDSEVALKKWEDTDLLEALSRFQGWLLGVREAAVADKRKEGESDEIENLWRRVEEGLGKYPGRGTAQEERLKSLPALAIAVAEFISKGGAMTIERRGALVKIDEKGTRPIINLVAIDTDEAVNDLQTRLQKPGLGENQKMVLKTTLTKILGLREMLADYYEMGEGYQFVERTRDVWRWLEGKEQRIGLAGETSTGKGVVDELRRLAKRAEAGQFTGQDMEGLIDAGGRFMLRQRETLRRGTAVREVEEMSLLRELNLKAGVIEKAMEDIRMYLSNARKNRLAAEEIEDLRRKVVFVGGLMMILAEPATGTVGDILDEAFGFLQVEERRKGLLK